MTPNDSVANVANDKQYLHKYKSNEDKRNSNKMVNLFSSSDENEGKQR